MAGLGNFGSFQSINFGRTLVVLFKLLSLVLGGQGYERSNTHKR